MSDENEQNQGLQVAHTPGGSAENPGARGEAEQLSIDPARAAKVGSAQAVAEAAMAELAEQIRQDKAEPEQASLLLAHPDDARCLFGGPVRHVANMMDAAKRGRGRPKGSQNKRSPDLANYLLSMGYRDPALNLADLANADPLGLAVEMLALDLPEAEGYSPQQKLHAAVQAGVIEREALGKITEKAFKLMKEANAELLPYFHSKRPTEIHVEERQLGVMIIGEMQAERADDDGTISLTNVAKPD